MLLGTVERGHRPNEPLPAPSRLGPDRLTNEKHLSAFKEMGDFASFKGRSSMVRVPYLRRVDEEERVYGFRLRESVAKHVAPHSTWGGASGGAHPLKKPVSDRYKGDLRKLPTTSRRWKRRASTTRAARPTASPRSRPAS